MEGPAPDHSEGDDASDGDAPRRLPEAPRSATSDTRRIRIAWTGSAVGVVMDSGVAAVGGEQLAQVREHGVEVDLHHPGVATDSPNPCVTIRICRVVGERLRFEWDRWYRHTAWLRSCRVLRECPVLSVVRA
jgi:hypothetical protein